MTGLLNPKSSEIGHFLLHDSPCVPRPWDFLSGSSFFFVLHISFWERSQASKLRNLEEKKEVHLDRSTRHTTILPLVLRFVLGPRGWTMRRGGTRPSPNDRATLPDI